MEPEVVSSPNNTTIITSLTTGAVVAFLQWLTLWFKEQREKRKEKERLKQEAIERAERERQEEETRKKLAKQTGIESYILTDLQVKHVENRIYKTYNFMRSFVIHIHNGEFTDALLTLIKITIKHEVTQTHSVKTIADNYQAKPIPEMFYSMMRRVVKMGYYYLQDREILNDSPDSKNANKPLYDWMSLYDAQSMVCVALRSNVTNKVVAILCLQFHTKGWLHEKDINAIREEAKAIEDIYDKLRV